MLRPAVPASLKQARYHAVFVDINVFRRRVLWQPRHGHDISGKHNNKSGACRHLDVFNGHRKAFGSTETCWIVRKAVLRFCYAYGKISEAQSRQLVDLLFGSR